MQEQTRQNQHLMQTASNLLLAQFHLQHHLLHLQRPPLLLRHQLRRPCYRRGRPQYLSLHAPPPIHLLDFGNCLRLL